ncbi:MAG: GNAT family N-acetyltransferase [Gammaproteobacteria bacterium]|nr:GNAT family N-acetyltransferase [Gammaproteobacteria bacterium]
MKDCLVRPVSTTTDSAAIAEIYNHYIRHTVVTFEEVEITAEQMLDRINTITLASLPWLVAEVSGKVVGYAYAGKFHTRSAYRFTAETTVYLEKNASGQGIGTRLYQALLLQLKQKNFHSIIGIIALPNEASVKLHEKFDFKKIGHFSEVGNKFNQWLDVGYWQVVLNA